MASLLIVSHSRTGGTTRLVEAVRAGASHPDIDGVEVIEVDALDGETIDIHTSDGDLDLGTITARSITARTSDGDIRVTSLNGDAEVKTSDGDIDIDSATGSSFFARTSDGDITVGELIAGRSTVRSSDGDITLRRVEGDLNVSGSNANIRLDLYKPGAVTATTSDGDILITLSENHGADLRLRGDDVRISRSLDFDGRIEDIGEYCLRDVRATAELYRRLEGTLLPLFKGGRG